MRRIFSLFLLMAFTINICAIDELQIKPHQTIAGLSDESDDAYIELYLVNESFDIANLQFDILLPEGMEYADYGEFTDRVPSTTKKGNKTYDFSYQTNALEDGYTRFMFIPGGEMRKIEKGSGTILYINFKTNANMAAGIHPILMKNIKLVESTTSAITIDDVSSYVIIGDNNPLKTETDINMSSLIGSIPSFVVQAINADIASNAGLKYIDLTGADALGADFVMPNDQAKIVVKEGSPLANLSYAVTSKEPAVEGIAINETNFPDANFRSYLLSEDYGSDGVITDAEIAEITYIGVDEKNIANLKGIEFFTALAILSCSNNQLTSLDITKNTALAILSCSNNQLTALDVSNNKELIYLDCSHNKLATLNVTGCTALGEPFFLGDGGILYCAGNQIKGAAMDAFIESLPVNANMCKLQIIDKENEGNVITAAQVAAARAKGWKPLALNEEDNKWYSYLGSDVPTPEPVEINETNFPDEIFRNYVSSRFDKNGDGKLSFYEGQRGDMEPDGLGIKSLKGIEFFTEIEGLYCHDNLLTELDVSKNTALKELYCSRNQLKSLDVSKNTALEVLKCKENQISAIDISNNTLLRKLDITKNQLTTLDISNNLAMEELYVVENQLTVLDVSKHSALRQLECNENQLASLVLSNKPKLEKLLCDNNLLTELDLSETPVLDNLRCYNNQLTTLDVSKNTALTELICSNNQLTALDVSKNTALTELDCVENQLTALVVSKNSELSYLYCYKNQIKGAAMDALVASLPQQTSANLRVIYYENEGNVMTTTQVAAAKAKGWQVYHCTGTTYDPVYDFNFEDWEEYAGSDPTAIEGIESDTSASKSGSDVYFDLSGRRVMTPTKGVYVKNGKKVVVK